MVDSVAIGGQLRFVQAYMFDSGHWGKGSFLGGGLEKDVLDGCLELIVV